MTKKDRTTRWKAILATIVGMVFSGASLAGDPLTVARGSELIIGETTEVGAVTVHGVLKVTGGDFKVVDGNPVYVDLGPDAGDVGEMIVTNAVISEPTGTAKICVRIGQNGGGDSARLRLYKTTSKWSYLKYFILSAAASTAADSFEALEIGEGGFYRLSQVQNYNAKPLVVSFTGTGAQIDKFWNGDFFLLAGGGDIVLKSVNGNAIAIGGYRSAGATANFFAANPNGQLRTEGAGDVTINVNGGNAGDPAIFCLNAANVAWGHSGDLLIGDASASRGGIFKVTADNALPYGATTGEVVVRSNNGSTTNVLDICGTSQRVRSLVATGASVITNSSPQEAVFVFGQGDADGRISGVNLTNAAIRCVKTGTGTLTLDGASLNSLSGGGGAIYVASKTYVDTLALTNASISFANGDTSLLQARNMMVDSSVTMSLPDGTATNCVFLSFPTLRGATAVKDGAGFVTYATPADADGTCLDVRGGVLRLGGETCSNSFWRLILKKANNNGQTYSFADGGSKFISVGLGTFALYTEAGAHTIGAASAYKCDTGDDPDNAASIPAGKVTTKNPALAWSQSICQTQHPGQTGDPILGGGESRQDVSVLIQNGNITDNRYDYPCTSSDYRPTLFIWVTSVIFDGAVLNPDDSSTWEIITWKNNSSSWPKSHASYAMRRTVNWSRPTDPYLTDWELQSSPSGQPGTWVTMDERANQRWWSKTEAGSCGLDPQYQFTYNNHIPYLFKSRNALWRFTTFGAVSVAAGAKLDLSELREENIAFNALKVDMAAGAGTISHFAPAANGVLYLTNVSAAQLSANKLRVPLSIDTWISSDNLSTWTVSVDGTTVRDLGVVVRDGELWLVRRQGLVLFVR